MYEYNEDALKVYAYYHGKWAYGWEVADGSYMWPPRGVYDTKAKAVAALHAYIDRCEMWGYPE